MGEPYAAYIDTLAKIDTDRLQKELNSDQFRLPFWINMYNALVQVKIKEGSENYNDRNVFFETKDLSIGGKKLSLNDIENGILRKTAKNNEFISSFELEKKDYRIHFALNCGASACPPIAFYSAQNIESELTMAEEVFILAGSTYTKESNTVQISELFKWFKDDFGGEDGILELLKKHKIISDTSGVKIMYTPYDWTLNTDNFQ